MPPTTTQADCPRDATPSCWWQRPGCGSFFYDSGVFSEDEEGYGSDDSDSEGQLSNDHDDDDEGIRGANDSEDEHDSDDEVGAAAAGGGGAGLQATMTGAATAESYGRPPPYLSEHCPPLPASGYGPDPAEHCSCCMGAQFCLIEPDMADWLQRERAKATASVDDVRVVVLLSARALCC